MRGLRGACRAGGTHTYARSVFITFEANYSNAANHALGSYINALWFSKTKEEVRLLRLHNYRRVVSRTVKITKEGRKEGKGERVWKLIRKLERLKSMESKLWKELSKEVTEGEETMEGRDYWRERNYWMERNYGGNVNVTRKAHMAKIRSQGVTLLKQRQSAYFLQYVRLLLLTRAHRFKYVLYRHVVVNK